MGKFRSRLGMVVALAVLAGACGDDDDGTATSATSGASAETTGSAGAATTVASTVAGDAGAGLPSGITVEGGGEADLVGARGTGLQRGVTDTTVTIGCIVTAANNPGFEDGLRARFERANAEGIHGRTVDLLACEDDGLDPAINQNLARAAVLQDEVFGLVNMSNGGMLPPTSDFLTEQEVPYVGFGIAPGYCGHRWGFGFTGCLIPGALPDLVPHPYDNGALVDAGIELSGLPTDQLRFAIIACDMEACQAGNQIFSNMFRARGVEVVYEEAALPASVTDYTPFVEAILAADPNIVYLNTQLKDVGPMNQGLTTRGFGGVVMNFIAYQPGLLEDSPDLAASFEGVDINVGIEPEEAQTPYVEEVKADLAAIGADTRIRLGTAFGYQIANLWVQMLEASGPELDTRTFDAAVNVEGFRFRSGYADGAGDLPFPNGHFVPVPCGTVITVQDGTYVVTKPMTCYELIPIG